MLIQLIDYRQHTVSTTKKENFKTSLIMFFRHLFRSAIKKLFSYTQYLVDTLANYFNHQ